MPFLLFIILLVIPVKGASLQLEFRNYFGQDRLRLDALKLEAQEKLSITRLSYLLSQFAIQDTQGRWHELEDQFAYLDASKRLTSFKLTGVQVGRYQAVRFSVGVPKKFNHAPPSKLSSGHPLNPNLNQLHWD